MNVSRTCVSKLNAKGLFENPQHLSRFSELVSCYQDAPFFTKGLCKCMYLSSWDDEHFVVILGILNSLTIGKNIDTAEMSEHGKYLEEDSEGDSKEIMRLASCLLNDETYELPAEGSLSQEGKHIIDSALEASRILDIVFDFQ